MTFKFKDWQWHISPVLSPLPFLLHCQYRNIMKGSRAADDERFDDAMRGNLDAVSKLPRIDGIDESGIFTVSSSEECRARLPTQFAGLSTMKLRTIPTKRNDGTKGRRKGRTGLKRFSSLLGCHTPKQWPSTKKFFSGDMCK